MRAKVPLNDKPIQVFRFSTVEAVGSGDTSNVDRVRAYISLLHTVCTREYMVYSGAVRFNCGLLTASVSQSFMSLAWFSHQFRNTNLYFGLLTADFKTNVAKC